MCGGAFLRFGRPRGPRKALQNLGGEAPYIFEAFPGPRGRLDLNSAPDKFRPDCLQVPRPMSYHPGAVAVARSFSGPRGLSGIDSVRVAARCVRISASYRHSAKRQHYFMSIKSKIFIRFLVGFRPNLAPRPAPTGRARQMVQHAPKVSAGDQF